MGKLILKELVTILGKSPAKKGNEFFLPYFIQSILNYKNNDLIEFPGMNKQRIGYTKLMYKVLFETLDTRNQVDVPFVIAPHMRSIFLTPLVQPKYHKLSVEWSLMMDEVPNAPNLGVPNPSSNPCLNPLDDSKPIATTSQKDLVDKKKKRKPVL